MEDDCRPLLSSEQTGESYSHRGSTDSLDFKAKRYLTLKHYTYQYAVLTSVVLAGT